MQRNERSTTLGRPEFDAAPNTPTPGTDPASQGRDSARSPASGKRHPTCKANSTALKNAAPAAGGPSGSRVVAAIALAMGIALLAAGAILGGPRPPPSVLPPGIALVGIGAYLFSSGRPSRGEHAESPRAASLRKSLGQAGTQLEHLQSALEREAAPLGLKTIDEPSLIAAEGSLDDEQNRIHEWGPSLQSPRRREKSGQAAKEQSGEFQGIRRGGRESARIRRDRVAAVARRPRPARDILAGDGGGTSRQGRAWTQPTARSEEPAATASTPFGKTSTIMSP